MNVDPFEPKNGPWAGPLVVIIGLILVMYFFGGKAHGRENGQWQYASPDIKAYFNTLMQPDQSPPVSCCGDADAYYADNTETGPDGGIVAIITDTRNDDVLKRKHIPVGTKIPVPPSKIRRHPIPNPTGHTIIFVSPYNRFVYCYEPQALL